MTNNVKIVKNLDILLFVNYANCCRNEHIYAPYLNQTNKMQNLCMEAIKDLDKKKLS